MYPTSPRRPVFVPALFVSLVCGGLALTGMSAAEGTKPAALKPVATPQAAPKQAQPRPTFSPEKSVRVERAFGAGKVAKPHPTWSRPKPAAPPGESAEETLIRVYHLKYADGRTVLEAVHSVAPIAKTVFDERNNSILVAAPPVAFAPVEEIVELLDVPPARDLAEGGRLHVYQLHHVEPENAVRALELLLGLPGSTDVRVDADPKNSRILVYAPLSVHLEVTQLLEKLDVPPDRDAGLQLKIFSLVHAHAETLAETVSALFEANDVTVSVDPVSNSLVAKGPEEALMVIEALLQRLDESEGQEARRTFQVRVVWLVSGLEDQQPAPPADDLKEVLRELQKAGIEDVRQVGQAMVRTLAGGRFQIDSLPVLGKNPSELRVSGVLEDREGTPYLDIQLSAKHLVCVACDSDVAEEAEQPARRRLEYERLVNLKTEISAPFGHYVVLGVTPVGKTTSIFVVQVTPSK